MTGDHRNPRRRVTLGPASEVPAGAEIGLQVSVRRTCAGGGHNSGTARGWFNGQPADSGAARDAGSRIQLTIGGVAADYFLRASFGLSTTAGAARLSTDAAVNSIVACTARPYSVLGVWSTTLQ